MTLKNNTQPVTYRLQNVPPTALYSVVTRLYKADVVCTVNSDKVKEPLIITPLSPDIKSVRYQLQRWLARLPEDAEDATYAEKVKTTIEIFSPKLTTSVQTYLIAVESGLKLING